MHNLCRISYYRCLSHQRGEKYGRRNILALTANHYRVGATVWKTLDGYTFALLILHLFLVGLSHLFPYVVPHVHKKWRIFAENLGLKDEDLGTIVEIPHGKQSRYAQSVLELWLNKDGTQASKSKLIQALEATGLKKALGKSNI